MRAPLPPPRRRPTVPRAGAALLAPALLAASAPASANGRYPAAGLIAADPSDSAHLVVRATYGVLSTRDAGAEWRWTCEPAVGFGGYEDPMIAILQGGTLVAGVFKGLSSSANGGCDWDFAGGGLADRYVTDLSAERGDPSRAVLVVSNGIGNGQFRTQLWETADGAASWTQAGADLPLDLLAFTVDVAPSDPSRVYVSGRSGAPGYAGSLQRSPDRGQTWDPLPIPGTDGQHLAFIGAIDPADPDVIYVRIDGDPTDSLIVSKNGGQTFDPIFEGTGDLLGFALSPDGSKVLVGGPQDGLWRAPASTLQFEKIADVGARCLTWTAEGVLACGDEFTDGFTAGKSVDDGVSFTPILHLDSLCGPLVCDAGSDVASICTDLWGATELMVGAQECGGAGAGGGGGSEAPPDGPGGCSCRAGALAGQPAWILIAAAGAAATARRRYRRGSVITTTR